MPRQILPSAISLRLSLLFAMFLLTMNSPVTARPEETGISKLRSLEVRVAGKLIRDTKEVSKLPKKWHFMEVEAYDAWWKKTGWKESEKPKIDFSKSVVVMLSHNSGDPNYRTWGAALTEDGTLNVYCLSYTKRGWTPTGQIAILFLTVPREGVKSIGRNSPNLGSELSPIVP